MKRHTGKFMTVRQARLEKLAADERRFPIATPVVITDPRVGQLCRSGRPIYYAFINAQYVESRDLAALERQLTVEGR